MKLLHLSDLHIGRGNNFDNADTILKEIDNKYKDNDDKPVILITGDITDDGKRWQYQLTKSLLDNYISRGYQVLLCPGNHDYGKNGIKAKRENIDRYERYLSQDIDFPVVKKIGNCHFIALDSMEDEKGTLDRFGAEGEIGDDQLYDLNCDIETIREDYPNDRIIVYLHQHPFYYNFFLRLKDADDFKEVIKNKVDILLFGHKHVEKKFTTKESKYGIDLILASKKSTDIEKGTLSTTNGQPVFRFFEIDTTNLSADPIEVLA